MLSRDYIILYWANFNDRNLNKNDRMYDQFMIKDIQTNARIFKLILPYTKKQFAHAEVIK